MTSAADHYGTVEIKERIRAALLEAGKDPESRLGVEETGPLDHFHTGGRPATLKLAELASPRRGSSVLDLGAGLGGGARVLASGYECRVTCLDATPAFCEANEMLNAMTGLGDRIQILQGDALNLPFEDASFDLVWMQNVSMNISDKSRLYGEIRRVLKGGGRYVFQEPFQGPVEPIILPVAWAETADLSFLLTPQQLVAALNSAGFKQTTLEDTTDAIRAQPPPPPNPLGFQVFMSDMPVKVANAKLNNDEERTVILRGIFEAV